MFYLLYSPLEQFEISPIILFYFSFFDFSISKATFILLVSCYLFFLLVEAVFLPKYSPKILKTNWQFFFENIIKISSSLLFDNIGKEGEKFLPLIFSLFSFITLVNIIGLIPYSFTITSHLITTFSFAFFIFIGINVIGFKKHGSELLCLFLPSGTSIFLAFLLVPIEIVSYIFKPISLSVRLFANMMAGHTLTHVISGFSWSMLSLGGYFFFFHMFPLFILVFLMGLEFAVAVIQAYVFSVLSCIYLNDVLHMH